MERMSASLFAPVSSRTKMYCPGIGSETSSPGISELPGRSAGADFDRSGVSATGLSEGVAVGDGESHAVVINRSAITPKARPRRITEVKFMWEGGIGEYRVLKSKPSRVSPDRVFHCRERAYCRFLESAYNLNGVVTVLKPFIHDWWKIHSCDGNLIIILSKSAIFTHGDFDIQWIDVHT